MRGENGDGLVNGRILRFWVMVRQIGPAGPVGIGDGHE